VLDVISRYFPLELPVIFVQGAVCRPSWLVEIEGIAIVPDRTEYPVFL
jgi:hypothetical protein